MSKMRSGSSIVSSNEAFISTAYEPIGATSHPSDPHCTRTHAARSSCSLPTAIFTDDQLLASLSFVLIRLPDFQGFHTSVLTGDQHILDWILLLWYFAGSAAIPDGFLACAGQANRAEVAPAIEKHQIAWNNGYSAATPRPILRFEYSRYHACVGSNGFLGIHRVHQVDSHSITRK
jgi:hypothetical protein